MWRGPGRLQPCCRGVGNPLRVPLPLTAPHLAIPATEGSAVSVVKTMCLAHHKSGGCTCPVYRLGFALRQFAAITMTPQLSPGRSHGTGPLSFFSVLVGGIPLAMPVEAASRSRVFRCVRSPTGSVGWPLAPVQRRPILCGVLRVH